MSTTAPEQTPPDERARPETSAPFRADVEGLRAVAIGLVLLLHVGVTTFAGGFVGVDVFFVISGFLITSQLVRELDRTGRISLAAFYARRVRRILPAAAVALVGSAVVTVAVAPREHLRFVGGDIVSSALYVVNWRIKDRLAYHAYDQPSLTPVSHFWSLAVEEQFYLVWPLVVLVAAVLAAWLRTRSRTLVWVGIAAIAAGSLAWSLVNTAHSPHTAYYSTITRLWQLAVGGVVALAAAWLSRLPRWLAAALGWGGLGAVLASGLLFTLDDPWPGYRALVPTLGTAAVIAAGFTAQRAGPAVVLRTAPLRWVGRLSYSLYLWHWPLLYLASLSLGGLRPPVAVAVLGVCVCVAWLSYTLVEGPARRSPALNRSSAKSLGVGVALSLTGVAAGLLVTLVDR